MCTRFLTCLTAFVAGVLLMADAADAQRNFYIPGNFMSEAFDYTDWTPTDYAVPGDAMVETSSGSGIYELNFDLTTGTTPGTVGQQYGFKILEDLSGDGAAFSNPDDPEITPNDSWFFGDADGAMTIRLDTNTYDDGLFPQTNRIAIVDDVDTWTVIGNFQTQLGATADYDNDYAGTAMTETAPDSGVFELTTMIPTAGNYNFRTVNTGTFLGVGTDQRRNDAANLSFLTFEENQEVTFRLDTNVGAFGFFTDAVLAGDTDNDGMVEFEDDFFPILNNFLTETFLRAEGDLDGSGFVDIRDFREWKNAALAEGITPTQVGIAFAMLNGGQAPEPGGLFLLGVAMVAAVRRRR